MRKGAEQFLGGGGGKARRVPPRTRHTAASRLPVPAPASARQRQLKLTCRRGCVSRQGVPAAGWPAQTASPFGTASRPCARRRRCVRKLPSQLHSCVSRWRRRPARRGRANSNTGALPPLLRACPAPTHPEARLASAHGQHGSRNTIAPACCRAAREGSSGRIMIEALPASNARFRTRSNLVATRKAKSTRHVLRADKTLQNLCKTVHRLVIAA